MVPQPSTFRRDFGGRVPLDLAQVLCQGPRRRCSADGSFGMIPRESRDGLRVASPRRDHPSFALTRFFSGGVGGALAASRRDTTNAQTYRHGGSLWNLTSSAEGLLVNSESSEVSPAIPGHTSCSFSEHTPAWSSPAGQELLSGIGVLVAVLAASISAHARSTRPGRSRSSKRRQKRPGGSGSAGPVPVQRKSS